MTHRDGLPRFSARSARRGDAVYREPGATLSESLGKPPFRSPMRPVGGRGGAPRMWNRGGTPRPPRGRRQALTMSRIARGFPPTRLPTIWHGPKRAAWTIPIGHYYRSLVSTPHPERISVNVNGV